MGCPGFKVRLGASDATLLSGRVAEVLASSEKLQKCSRGQVLVEYLIVFSVKVSMCRLAGA